MSNPLRRFLGIEGRAVSFQDVFGRDLLGRVGSRTTSGQDVNTTTAMRLTAVFGSWRILGDTVSTLPVDSLITWDGASKQYRPRPVWLDFQVNEFGQIEVLNQAVLSLLGDGNAFFFTPRNELGQVTRIEVLDPALVTNERTDQGLVYRVNGQVVPPGAVLHVPGMMLPGATRGISPIKACAEAIGLGIAAQEYGAAFFGNSGIPGAIVEAPNGISDTGVKQLKAAWNDVHQGAGNAHRLAVLTEGAKFTKITVDPDDAQFLETRAFTVPDIARIYGVPPHLLADASGSTSWGSGLAEQNIAFAQFALRPWVSRLESGLTRLMRSEGHSPSAFVRIDLTDLKRGGSLKERIEAYSLGLQQGVYNLDEVRGWEDLPALPAGRGKTHRIPLNLGEVGASLPPAAKRALADELRRAADIEESS